MTDITVAASPSARKQWVALAILLLLGLSFAATASIRIKRTDVFATTDNGILVTTDDGQKVLVTRQCRLVVGAFALPLSWRCLP